MPTPSATTMFASFGNLADYMNFDAFTSFGESWISGQVINSFFTSKLGAAHVIYGADIMSLCASLAVAAFVIYYSVDRSVGFVDSLDDFFGGLYHDYAGWSDLGNLKYLLEIIVVLAW